MLGYSQWDAYKCVCVGGGEGGGGGGGVVKDIERIKIMWNFLRCITQFCGVSFMSEIMFCLKFPVVKRA